VPAAPVDPVAIATGSQLLRGKIKLVLPALVGAGERLVAHPRIADLYPEYLFTTHCIIRASVPLMETAAEQARTPGNEDPVAAPLAAYLEEHIVEELHHDDWLLEDFEVLKRSRAEILSRTPSPTVASLVGAQYYWILHYHPVCLLGYIAVLEGYPPTTSAIDDLIAQTGYPPEAFRTLKKHAELDLGHGDELDRMFDSLPLTADQTTAVGLSALWTTHMAARAIDEIVEGFPAAG
jgi:hypothetical protein